MIHFPVCHWRWKVFTETLGHQDLIDQLLTARSTTELQEAQHLTESWMQEHPDDFGVFDSAEQVAMLLDAARYPDADVTTC